MRHVPSRRALFLRTGATPHLVFQTSKSGLFNPSVTVTSGTVTWDYGDGTTSIGATANKTYPNSATKTVTVTFSNPAAVTHLALQSTSLVGTFALSQLAILSGLREFRGYSNASWNVTGALGDLPSGMTYLHLASTSSTITGALADLPASMVQLYLYSNASWNVTGALGDLPSGMTHLHLANTPSTITGALADLPASMVLLYLFSTPSTITGALGDLPSTMTYLHLDSTSSTITGAGTPAALGIQQLELSSCVYTQAELDTMLQWLYTYRNSWTYASPVLNIAGTNPATGGTYAYNATPATGKEYEYALEHPADYGGSWKTWAITAN